MRFQGGIENFLRRDTIISAVTLISVVAMSWAYIISGAGMSMPTDAISSGSNMQMSDMIMTRGIWSTEYALIVFVMWSVMMMAMMFPSASPMILLFIALNRKRSERSFWSITAFGSAYAAACCGFSILATGSQWAL